MWLNPLEPQLIAFAKSVALKIIIRRAYGSIPHTSDSKTFLVDVDLDIDAIDIYDDRHSLSS